MLYVKRSFSLPAVSQRPQGEHLPGGSIPDSAQKCRRKRQRYLQDRAVAPSHDGADGGATLDRLF